jgi:hypothetical protein
MDNGKLIIRMELDIPCYYNKEKIKLVEVFDHSDDVDDPYSLAGKYRIVINNKYFTYRETINELFERFGIKEYKVWQRKKKLMKIN